jgi:DNA-binding NarL/FixJ family response regulator
MTTAIDAETSRANNRVMDRAFVQTHNCGSTVSATGAAVKLRDFLRVSISSASQKGIRPMSRPEERDSLSKKWRILVVDGHLISRQALGLLLARESSLEVCGEAEDESEAIQQIELRCPELVVMDIALKNGSSGFRLISTIRQRYPGIKTLIWSMFAEKLLVERALRIGATGYLSKEESLELVGEAIQQMLRDRRYLSPLMTRKVLELVSDGTPLGNDNLQNLSSREMEVFEMIGRGLTTQQIAAKLEVSSKTVDSHRERIKQKLDLKNGTELTHRAAQWVLRKE